MSASLALQPIAPPVFAAPDWMSKLRDSFIAQVRKGDSLTLAVTTYAIGALIMKYLIDWSTINVRVISKVNFFEIKDPVWKKRMAYWRGDNYGLETHDFSGRPIPKASQRRVPRGEKPYHVMTGWSCLHVLLYAVLGFAAPKHWPTFLLVSGLWELFEFHGSNDYHDLLDIGWNSAGMLLGMTLRKLVLKS